MKIKDILNEVPIGDFDKFPGKVNKFPSAFAGGSISDPKKASKLLSKLKSEGFIKELRKRFQNTPYVFNIYYVDDTEIVSIDFIDPNLDWMEEIPDEIYDPQSNVDAKLTVDYVAKELKSKIKKIQKPGQISIIIANYSGSSHMDSISTWSLTHDIAHAVVFGGSGHMSKFKSTMKELIRPTSKKYFNYYNFDIDDYHDPEVFISGVSTLKTVEQVMSNDPGEIYIELMVQHLIGKNGIRFKVNPDMFDYKKVPNGFESDLKKLQEKIESYTESVLKECEGKVLVSSA